MMAGRSKLLMALVALSGAHGVGAHGFLRKLPETLGDLAAATELEARDPFPDWPCGRFQVWDSLTSDQQKEVKDTLGCKL